MLIQSVSFKTNINSTNHNTRDVMYGKTIIININILFLHYNVVIHILF